SSPTGEQRMMITDGIALHDSQKYDQAIAKYQEVIEQSPDLVSAIYEMAFTSFAKKDYERTLDLTRQGMRYKSDLLPQFYLLFGNCLDEIGRRQDAIDVYRAAIKRTPTVALLHYNLGVSLIRSGKKADAKASLQQSARLDPNHGRTHYLLANIYAELG